MTDDQNWERVPRWRAVVHYRSENGLIDVEHWFEELEELHDIVERGPSFQAIEKIEIDQRVKKRGQTRRQILKRAGRQTLRKPRQDLTAF